MFQGKSFDSRMNWAQFFYRDTDTVAIAAPGTTTGLGRTAMTIRKALLSFRKDCVDDFLQALGNFFVVRQCLHDGDLAGQAGRNSAAH